jgi:transcriptional regulator with XRE-family HTH domain
MTKIAENLIFLRKQNKLTQKDLAAHLKVAESTISSYENEAREPNLDTVVKLADLFNVSTDRLLGRDFSVTSEHVIDAGIEKEIRSRVEVHMKEFADQFVRYAKDKIVMEIKDEMEEGK